MLIEMNNDMDFKPQFSCDQILENPNFDHVSINKSIGKQTPLQYRHKKTKYNMTNVRPTVSPSKPCISCSHCKNRNTNITSWDCDRKLNEHTSEDLYIPDFNYPFEDLEFGAKNHPLSLSPNCQVPSEQAGMLHEPLVPPPGGELFSEWISKKFKTSSDKKSQEGSISSQKNGNQWNTICNHSPKCTHTATRSKAWSHIEEVVLVGVVFDRFFSQGSLNTNSNKNEEYEPCAWKTLKLIYEHILVEYAQQSLTCYTFSERTTKALSRHYKVMKSRITEGKDIGFKAYYTEFEALSLKLYQQQAELQAATQDRRSQFNANFRIQKKKTNPTRRYIIKGPKYVIKGNQPSLSDQETAYQQTQMTKQFDLLPSIRRKRKKDEHS